MASNVPAAVSNGFQPQCMPHRFRIAQKIEQLGRVNEPRDRKQ
jgi:hypothetical protein